MSKTPSVAAARKAALKAVPAIMALSVPPALAEKQAALVGDKPAVTPFSNFVATQVAAAEKSSTPVIVEPIAPLSAAPVVVVPVVVKTPLRVQNGRKEYSPGTEGRQIFETADALQAMSPGTWIESGVMRVALPHIPAASISAGMTHWRKFNGLKKHK